MHQRPASAEAVPLCYFQRGTERDRQAGNDKPKLLQPDEMQHMVLPTVCTPQGRTSPPQTLIKNIYYVGNKLYKNIKSHAPPSWQ